MHTDHTSFTVQCAFQFVHNAYGEEKQTNKQTKNVYIKLAVFEYTCVNPYLGEKDWQ